jgi:hypothetical protein
MRAQLLDRIDRKWKKVVSAFFSNLLSIQNQIMPFIGFVSQGLCFALCIVISFTSLSISAYPSPL